MSTCVGVLLATLVVACSRPAPDEIHPDAVVGLDDGSAVVVWRNLRKEVFIGRVKDVERVWVAPVASRPQPIGAPTLFVHGSLALVRGARVEGTSPVVTLEAFSLEDGGRRWEAVLGRYSEGTLGLLGKPMQTDVSGGLSIDQLVTKGNDTELVRIEPQSGAIAATARIPSSVFEWRWLGQYAVVKEYGISVLDGVERLTHDRSGFVGCSGSDGYTYLRYAEAGVELVRMERDDPRVKSVSSFRMEHPWSVRDCMTYGGYTVMIAIDMRTSLLSIVDHVGRETARIPLEGRMFPDFGREDRATRFVPFVTSDSEHHVQVVDFERRAIVARWKSTVSTETFRVGDRWYIVEIGIGVSYLTMLDGNNGHIETVRIHGYIEHVSPTNVGGGRLWLSGSEYSPELAVISLDDTTLRTRTTASWIAIEPIAGRDVSGVRD